MDICIADNIRFVGVDDTDIDLFEAQYPVPKGISYNSYRVFDTFDTRLLEFGT